MRRLNSRWRPAALGPVGPVLGRTPIGDGGQRRLALEIRGTVVRIHDDPTNAFIDSMANKHVGVDAYPFHQPGDERVVVHVEPNHTTHMG